MTAGPFLKGPLPSQRLAAVLQQLEFVRAYTLRLVQNLPAGAWHRLPPGGASTIAWQIGHLAMAEYRLTLDRIRGRRPTDDALISEDFLQRYGKGSTASAEPPFAEPLELLAVLDRVHQQARRELPTLSEQDLDAPPLKPHPLFDTKLAALHWCACHEMLHAGQIGLLRRQAGEAPLW